MPLRVLCGCEASQTLARAFRELGHEAYSCDLEPPYGPPAPVKQWHLQECIEAVLARDEHWDLICLFPPCRYLSAVGARWITATKADGSLLQPDRVAKRDEAVAFVLRIWEAAKKHSAHVALENPRGFLSRAWRSPDQWVSPHWWGSQMQKRTGLYLHGLPPLTQGQVSVPEIVRLPNGKHEPAYWHKSKGMRAKERTRMRSKLDAHFAAAIAQQWAAYITGTPAPTPEMAPATRVVAHVPANTHTINLNITLRIVTDQ